MRESDEIQHYRKLANDPGLSDRQRHIYKILEENEEAQARQEFEEQRNLAIPIAIGTASVPVFVAIERRELNEPD